MYITFNMIIVVIILMAVLHMSLNAGILEVGLVIHHIKFRVKRFVTLQLKDNYLRSCTE